MTRKSARKITMTSRDKHETGGGGILIVAPFRTDLYPNMKKSEL